MRRSKLEALTTWLKMRTAVAGSKTIIISLFLLEKDVPIQKTLNVLAPLNDSPTETIFDNSLFH